MMSRLSVNHDTTGVRALAGYAGNTPISVEKPTDMQGSGGRIVAGSLDDGTSVEIVAQSPASAKVAQSLTIGQTYPITGACTRSQGMMKIKLRGATAVARTP